MERLPVGSLVREQKKDADHNAYRVIGPHNLYKDYVVVSGSSSSQSGIAYIAELIAISHVFQEGEEACIISPYMMTNKVTAYAQDCYASSSQFVWLPDMAKFLGRKGKITKLDQDKGVTYCRMDSVSPILWWHENLLLPAQFDLATSSPARQGQGLDQVLEGLYDCMYGKRDDKEELLRKYRDLTGNDRPNFMQ